MEGEAWALKSSVKRAVVTAKSEAKVSSGGASATARWVRAANPEARRQAHTIAPTHTVHIPFRFDITALCRLHLQCLRQQARA